MADASQQEQVSLSPLGLQESQEYQPESTIVTRVRGRLAQWFKDRFDPSAVTGERMKTFDAIQGSFSGDTQAIIEKLREPWRRISQAVGVAEVAGDISLAATYGVVSFAFLGGPSAAAGSAFMGTLFQGHPVGQAVGMPIGAVIGLRFAVGHSLRVADAIVHRAQPVRHMDQYASRAARTILPRIIETGKALEDRVEGIIEQMRRGQVPQNQQVFVGSSLS